MPIRRLHANPARASAPDRSRNTREGRTRIFVSSNLGKCSVLRCNPYEPTRVSLANYLRRSMYIFLIGLYLALLCPLSVVAQKVTRHCHSRTRRRARTHSISLSSRCCAMANADFCPRREGILRRMSSYGRTASRASVTCWRAGRSNQTAASC
jgi:hypothetical protein